MYQYFAEGKAVRVMGLQIYQGMNNIPSYQGYHRPEIPAVTEEEVRRQDAERQAVRQTELPDYSELTALKEQDTRSRTADLENISLTFHKSESFDYLGSESSIDNLDVQKALSDMRRDSVLQEYQYFVGSAQNFSFRSEDGTVIPKF